MKRLLTMSMCILLVTAFFVGSGSASAHTAGKPAHAAIRVAKTLSQVSYGCYGLSCHGLDPSATHCTASNLAYKVMPSLQDASGTTIATGEGFYSYGCDSNWIQGTLTSNGSNLNIMISTSYPDGSEYQNFMFSR